MAKKSGTSAASLYRHKADLPVELTKAREAREVADADTLLARVGVLIASLEGIATKAEDAKQWLAAAGALREVGRCLRLLGELSGELGSGTIPMSRSTLRRLFKRHHRSIKEVAGDIGMSCESVSRWLKGRGNSVRIETAVLLGAKNLVAKEAKNKALREELSGQHGVTAA
jgi:hypothetical protein